MTTDGRSEARPATTLEDLLVPAIPGALSSLLLEAVADLHGLAKLGLAVGLGVVLWAVLRRRRRADADRGPRRDWRWPLVALAGIAGVVVLVTVFVTGRPTDETAITSLLSLALLSALALRGLSVPAAVAAALSGGLVGLCAGIALW